MPSDYTRRSRYGRITYQTWLGYPKRNRAPRVTGATPVTRCKPRTQPAHIDEHIGFAKREPKKQGRRLIFIRNPCGTWKRANLPVLKSDDYSIGDMKQPGLPGLEVCVRIVSVRSCVVRSFLPGIPPRATAIRLHDWPQTPFYLLRLHAIFGSEPP